MEKELYEEVAHLAHETNEDCHIRIYFKSPDEEFKNELCNLLEKYKFTVGL